MKNLVFVLMFVPVAGLVAQVKTVSLDSALNIAYANNKNLQSVAMESEYYRLQQKTSAELPKTEVSLTYGQYNSYYTRDNNLAVSQTIPFPTVFGARSSLAAAQAEGADLRAAMTKNELTYRVRQVYYELLFHGLYRDLLIGQDSVYVQFARSAQLRYDAGDATLLDRTTAETRLADVRNNQRLTDARILELNAELRALLDVDYAVSIDPSDSIIRPLVLEDDTTAMGANPYLAYIRQQIAIAAHEKEVVVREGLPEFRLGYFNQTLYGSPLDETNMTFAGTGNRFQGVQVGVVIPVWYGPQSARNQMAETRVAINQLAYEGELAMYQGYYDQAVQRYLASRVNLDYYRQAALPAVELVEQQGRTAYTAGEIGLSDYLLTLQQVIAIREGYVVALNNYNQSVIYLEYLAGK